MDTNQTIPVLIDEEEKIRAVAMDYVGGVLHCDPARMARALHPELAKRAYLPGPDGKPQKREMSAQQLIGVVDPEVRKPDPGQQTEVIILDRYEGAASVRTTFRDWVDFMHIVNVGGEWKIINVLWELTQERWLALGGTPGARMS